MTQLPLHPTLSRQFRLQFEPAQDRWVLLYPEGMVQLNQSAAQVLRRCDGAHQVGDVVRELETVFETQGIEPEIISLLEEAHHRGWIE